MFPVSPSQFSKFALVALVVLSSSACSRLQIGGMNDEPEVVAGGAPVVDINSSLYTVQQGDNLYLIGKRYGLRFQEIAAWNNITAPYTIYPGQQLTLSPNVAPVVAQPQPNTPVQTGEPQVLVFDWDTGTARAQRVYSAPPPQIITQAPEVNADWQTGQPRTTNVSIGDVEQALYYTVKPGDTLSLIARQYGVTYRDLAAWNSLSAPYNLTAGQTLLVSTNTPPVSPVVVDPAFTPGGTSGSGMSAMSSGNSARSMDSMSAMNSLPPSSGTMHYHRVQQGENLYRIARMYGRTYQEVAAWNGIPAPYHLRVGQHLQVSPSSSYNSLSLASANRAMPTVDGKYTVVRGDTLSSISRRFNRSVNELAAWNGLRKPYPLTVGQQLVVSPQMSMLSSRGTVLSTPKTIEPERITVSVPKPAPEIEQNVMVVSSANANHSTTRKTLRGEIVYHAVQQGETLASIADTYQQNTHELALWNGIAPPYPIYPGQTIMIYR